MTLNLISNLVDMRDGVATGRQFGLVTGIVTSIQDPMKLGRVKVLFPWLSGSEESNWARVAVPMAGATRGTFFLPEVNDEVLVGFNQGDLSQPFVLGALWNGKDAPPGDDQDGKNNVRVIRSRSGHVIRLNDEDGKETIEIVDKSEKNSIKIDTAKNTLTLTSDKDITLSAAQGTITLDAQKVEIKSSADSKLEAGAGLKVNASATLELKGATVNIN